MRKNTARHWLHACLDLLPVLLIPVFMIFSHRHDIASSTSYSEEVPVYYESNEVNTIDDLVVGNIYLFSNDTETFNTTTLIQCEEMIILSGDFRDSSYTPVGQMPYIQTVGSASSIRFVYDDDLQGYFLNNYSIYIVPSVVSNIPQQIVDMISYTDYKRVKTYTTITYDFDKDIMGSFVSNFNNTINQYFNMGNVFNMRSVYNWFNTNIFGGQAPTVIYSVYCIVIYEFVMDLLFLLYALFMWFIDMCKALIEKPLNSIK